VTNFIRLRRRPRLGPVAVLACVALFAACSDAHTNTAPVTTLVPSLRVTAAGYRVANRVASRAPGVLIAARDAPPQAREVAAARAWQVLYHSRDVAGRDIVVSGLVLLPHGHRPRGGWPVVAWAHGTTGLADRCAPSIASELGKDKNAVREVRGLLAHGLAVVASDYPGLGTPGVHSYLIGEADANAVIDSVPAAHAVLGTELSKAWVTVGHSEGGQTSLFVAQTARRRAPRFDFLGTVALAPASTLDALIPLVDATHDPVEQAYLVYALEGLSTVDPRVDVEHIVSPRVRSILADTTQGCIDDIINDFTRQHITDLLGVDAATKSRLSSELGRYDNPDHAAAVGPVLIAQGSIDTDVPQGATDQLVSRLCALGDHVQYKVYQGLDHNTLIAGSLTFVGDWIAARFAHEPAASTCGTRG
jgi:hypothetical protein